jgi:hypothetical protein
MILMGAIFGCLDSVLTLASTEDVDPFISSRELSSEVRRKRFAFSLRSQSDHVANINAYNSFIAHHESWDYARDNFLRVSNLTLISKYKQQYFNILQASGLLATTDAAHPPRATSKKLFFDTSPFSQGRGDVALIKACICAGLFPHVAQLHNGGSDTTENAFGTRQKRRKNTLTLTLKDGTHITGGKESACRMTEEAMMRVLKKSKDLIDFAAAEDFTAAPPASLYVFNEIFRIRESNTEFLSTVTSVSLWALLLFGVSESCLSFEGQLGICTIDGWIFFKTSRETLESLLSLKRLLDVCTWNKYRNPRDPVNNTVLREVRDVIVDILHREGGDPHSASGNQERGTVISPTAADVREIDKILMVSEQEEALGEQD